MEIDNHCKTEVEGQSKLPNIPSGNTSDSSCFICSKPKITPELTAAVLEMQGLPDTNEDKLNILKVICQLLRVRSEVIESLFSAHNVTFPFCLGCLKFIIDIILLREQLFQIETEIRDKIEYIETSIALGVDPSITSGIWMNADEIKLEPPESYEECRQLFQKEVMNEYLSKELLRKKIEEMDEAPRQFAVEFHPSLIQLKLQKNVFNITENGAGFSNIEISSSTFCLSKKNEEIVDQELSCADEMQVGFEQTVEERPSTPECGTEISDDSDYGSPSKKMKTQKKTGHVHMKSVDVQNETGKVRKKTGEVQKETGDVQNKTGTVQRKTGNVQEKTGTVQKKAVFTVRKMRCVQKKSGCALKKRNFKKEVSAKIDEESHSDSSDSNGSESSSSGSEETSSDESEDDDGIEKLTETCSFVQKIHANSFSGRKLNTKRITVDKITRNLVPLKQEAGKFKAKDGTIWTTQPPSGNCRTRVCDIAKEEGGLVGSAKNKNQTPTQLFKLMFPADIIDAIVDHTNRYAESVERKQVWKPLTRDEFYAYIGILLFLGVEKKRTYPLEDIWTTEPKYAIPSITATMSRPRFKEISRFIRFDDRVARHERSERTEGDEPSKLGYISEIFDPFVKNMGAHFRPYDHLVVDEMLVKYKGKVKFRVYMKSKPGKYGMKVWAVCDATTGYVLRLAVYEGKVGGEIEKELGKKVVLGLVKNYFNSGRVVTTDNFFTSKSLGLELMKQGMGLLGTLNKNRMDVIPEFAEGKGRDLQTSMFAFYKDFTMVSYVQRKNKSVVLLSTEHHSPDINPEVKNKPQMILDYNATKGGVDTADQMIGNFTCQRVTLRWPVKLFHAMIDIAALNAFIIWKIHHEKELKLKGSRRSFLRSLAEGLMEPTVAERSKLGTAKGLPTVVKNAMELMGYKVDSPHPGQKGESELFSNARCVLCTAPAKSRKRSRNRCAVCRIYVCNEHSVRIHHCNNCKYVPTPSHVKVKKFHPTNLFGIPDIPDLP